MTVPPLEEIQATVGHRFPGGTYTIEHWENFLVSHAVQSPPLEDGVAHPAFLFNAPLAGVGITIRDIFTLCQAESDEAVRAGEYRWVLHRPLQENRTYRMSGGIDDVQRKQGRRGGLMDVVSFTIEMRDAEDDGLVATVGNTWIFLRSE